MIKQSQKSTEVYATEIDLYSVIWQIQSNFWLFMENSHQFALDD